MTTLEALDASSPTLLQALRHGGEVTCADARGARLVTGGGDRALRVWQWTRGGGWAQAAVAKQAHRYGVTAAKWSPGGVLIASGGVDGTVRVWCARSLSARRALAAPGACAVRALCWAGGARVLAGHDDGAVTAWHVQRQQLLARVHQHQGALHALAAPAGGALLLAACTEGVLKFFDLEKVCENSDAGLSPPSPLAWFDGAHDMGALCAASSADGGAAATGGHDGRVRLWQVTGRGRDRTVEAGYTLEGHSAAVTALSWSRSAAGVLASSSLDRTARLWAAGACLCVLHAHTRYLTCVVLAPDMTYMITGSNDKTVRMWSLGALTMDDELEPPCVAHAHFGVGDLEGIGPVDTDDLLELEAKSLPDAGGEEAPGGGARLLWRSADAHEGAVNCISASGDLLVTASSDGMVRIFRWSASDGSLVLEHTLGERGYPALAADLGAGGALLLSGGLDATAQLWDVETGCVLRSLAPPMVAEGDTGGGGVRGARVSPHRPPLLLLATDDGVAPLWSLADPDPKPIHVYGGHAEAAVCCAWSGDGRVLATGGAAGELRLHRAPPAPATLACQTDAHDLGVQSCDFAPLSAGRALARSEAAEAVYLLATGGSDGLIKLWHVELTEELTGTQLSLRLLRELEAHGGGVSSARWGPSASGDGAECSLLLGSGGADRWARVWRVTLRGDVVRLRVVGAVPAGSAGGATATALMDGDILAMGTLSGELALWQLPAEAGDEAGAEAEEDSEGEDAEVEVEAPRWWGASGVARWLREHVARVPGAMISSDEEAALLQRARDENLTGSRLLDDPLDELLEHLGYGAESPELDEEASHSAIRERLLEELKWLRKDSPPPELAWSAPHALLCPLSHRVLREPARAADGCTYERTALHEWFLAADGAVSGVSGRRLRNARVHPNHRARAALRAFLLQQHHDAKSDT